MRSVVATLPKTLGLLSEQIARGGAVNGKSTQNHKFLSVLLLQEPDEIPRSGGQGIAVVELE